MQFDPVPILAAGAFLAFTIIWVWQFNKRIEPWLRERIGEMLGVKIVWRMQGRGRSWATTGDTSGARGFLVALWEFVVTFLLGVGTVFLALLLTGLILFSIYG